MIFDILFFVLLFVGLCVFPLEDIAGGLLYCIFAIICIIGQFYNMHLMVVTADELAFAQEKCEQNQGVKQIYFETVTCNNNAEFKIMIPEKSQ